MTALAPWAIAAAALLVLPEAFASSAGLTIMNQMMITVVFALSYNMLLGQGGLLSFGHAVYMGMGGFACVHMMNWETVFGLTPLPLLPVVGGLCGAGLAVLVGSFSTRSAGTGFAMISLGVGELIAALSVIAVAFFGGEGGISGDRTEGLPLSGIAFLRQIEVYYLIAFWTLLSAALMFAFTRTPLGQMANAVRDNAERAEFLGYSARWVRFRCFVASGFFAGVAGALFAINFEIATEENLNTAQSGVILLVTLLGGGGVFFGPILGAVVFTLLQSVLSLQTDLWAFYTGVLFVVTVMYFPGGLAGLIALHAPAYRSGRLAMLAPAYSRTLVPGALGVLGAACLLELVFHLRHAAPGDAEIRLFWARWDVHTLLPWGLAACACVAGGWLACRAVPGLRAAWDRANRALP